MAREIDYLDSPVVGTLKSFRDQVDRDDPGPMMLSDPRCHVTDRAEPEHDDGSPVWDGGVLNSLPCRGKDVGEIDETVVGRPFGHFDVGRFCLRDSQVLRLASRYFAIELRKPEQRCTVPLVFDLCGLALAEELLVTHEAMATRHLERYDNPIPRLDSSDMLSYLFDDPYRLVAENVPVLHEGCQGLVEVQIGPADVRARDPHDRISGFLDRRIQY